MLNLNDTLYFPIYAADLNRELRRNKSWAVTGNAYFQFGHTYFLPRASNPNAYLTLAGDWMKPNTEDLAKFIQFMNALKKHLKVDNIQLQPILFGQYKQVQREDEIISEWIMPVDVGGISRFNIHFYSPSTLVVRPVGNILLARKEYLAHVICACEYFITRSCER